MAATDSADEDELFSSLEDDPATLAHLRESRLQALHTEFTRAKLATDHNFGSVTTSTTDQAILDITTSSTYPRTVLHFFKPDFHRCGIMDRHLEALAAKHLEARFLRVDVQHAPFLVEKLGIRVLPVVIGFLEGKGAERVVGFEGLGGDGFETRVLEEKLIRGGVLERVGIARELAGKAVGSNGGRRGEKVDEDENIDDDDWD